MTDARRPAEDPGGASGRPGDPDEVMVALLTSPAVWEDPPPHVEEAVLAAISAEARQSSAAARARTRWAPAVMGAVAGAAAVAVLVVAVIGLDPLRVGLPGGTSPAPVEVVLDAAPDGPADARAELSFQALPDGSRIGVQVSGLPPAAAEEWYEVVLRRPDRPAVSAGSFHLRGGGEQVVLWAGIELRPDVVVEVLRQPQGETVLSSRP